MVSVNENHNTIDFLVSLSEQYHYSNLSNDFDCMVWLFNEKIVDELLYKHFSMNSEEFKKKLYPDFLTCSPQSREFIASFLFKNIHSTRYSFVFVTLQDVFTKYLINHPFEYDVKSYSPVIASSLYRDISQSLHFPTHFSIYENSQNKTLASISFISNHFYFSFYRDIHNNSSSSPDLFLFQLFSELYHEQFHALVSEMNLNPHCYKEDILKYQMTSVVKKLLNEFVIQKKGVVTKGTVFYDNNWINFDEEIDASIHGCVVGLKKLKEWNPTFDLENVFPYFENENSFLKRQKSTQFFRVGFFRDEYKMDYLLHILDLYLPAHPNYSQGILTKMYDEKGQRKNIEQLVNERDQAFSQASLEEQQDILSFYNELIYLFVKTYSFDSIDYYEDVRQSLEWKIHHLSLLIDQIESIESSTISGKITKFRNIQSLKKEIDFSKKFLLKMAKNQEVSYGL